MKKTRYKLIKGAVAFVMAGVMVASFTGCVSKKDNKADSNEEDNIQVQLNSDDVSKLVLITVVDPVNNKILREERYGYISKDKDTNSIIFDDVIDNYLKLTKLDPETYFVDADNGMEEKVNTTSLVKE